MNILAREGGTLLSFSLQTRRIISQDPTEEEGLVW